MTCYHLQLHLPTYVTLQGATKSKDEYDELIGQAKSIMKKILAKSSSIIGRTKIIYGAAIPVLISFMRRPRLRSLIIRIFHSLLTRKCSERINFQKIDAAYFIRKADGVKALLEMLDQKSNKVGMLTLAVECLRILAKNDEESEKIIFEGKGPKILLNIMMTHSYEYLLIVTSRLLKGMYATAHRTDFHLPLCTNYDVS